MWIWIRSSMRYAGPVEGPGWEPQPPRCEDCGYCLTGLTVSDQCPECGLAISESLPESRKPSPCAGASGTLTRIPAFFRTLTRVLLNRSFFRTLAVSGQHAAARRFAIWTCFLTATMSVAGVIVAGAIEDGGFGVLEESPARLAGFVLASLSWGTVVWILVIGLTTPIGMRFGYRSMLSHATVVFYHTAWFLPLAIYAFVVICLCLWIDHFEWANTIVGTWGEAKIDAGMIAIAVLLASWVVVLLVALGRLGRAVRQTRFANT